MSAISYTHQRFPPEVMPLEWASLVCDGQGRSLMEVPFDDMLSPAEWRARRTPPARRHALGPGPGRSGALELPALVVTGCADGAAVRGGFPDTDMEMVTSPSS